MNATRRLFLGVAAAALLAQAGCSPNLGSLMYFLTPEPPEDASMRHLADKSEKKAPRVVILTHTPHDIEIDMLRADRELADKLAREMADLGKMIGEKVNIVRSGLVDDYTNSHPSWHQGDLREVGKHFKADYVVYLEFGKFRMREPRSVDMYRGTAELDIHLLDVKNPDSETAPKPFIYTFPSDMRHGFAIDADTPPQKFREQFVGNLAKKLTLYFMNHPRQERYAID
jgi:hypothetical protein